MDINREELAWAAGLFDGEGSIYIRKEKAKTSDRILKYIQIDIGQTDRQVLDRFQKAVNGLGKVYGPYTTRSRVHKEWNQRWEFKGASFEHVQAIIAMLYQFLSPVKQGQTLGYLQEMREYFDTKPLRKDGYPKKATWNRK